MLHVTIIILVCFTVSAPSEGIAGTRQKNYLFQGFCLFEEKVPKVTEVSSSSIDNVDEEQFSDCVKHKITYRLSFFNNFFNNQYQYRKNNYCSIMNSFTETKKKDSGSSVEITYRKRNLLWSRKALESVKTLRPHTEATTEMTTLKPLEKHGLNFIEKKRFFSLQKPKVPKEKRVGKRTRGRYFADKPKNLGEEISLSGSEVVRDDQPEEKPQGSDQAFPRLHFSEKCIQFRRNKRKRDSVLKKNLRGRESAAGEATRLNQNVPNFKHSHSFVSNKRKKNARLFDVKNLNRENRKKSSNFNGLDHFFTFHNNDRFIRGHKSKKNRRRLGRFQNRVKTFPVRNNNCLSGSNQRIYDPKLEGNDKINTENRNGLSSANKMIDSNEYEDGEESQNSNAQEKKNGRDNESDGLNSDPDTKSAVPDCVADERQFGRNKERNDLLREILQYFMAVLNEDYNSREEPSEFRAPETTIKRPFLSDRKSKNEIPVTDFDFPDYDEIYDPAGDRLLKNYIPFHFHERRKLKFRKNAFPKRKHSKIQDSPISDQSCEIPLNCKKSLFFQKLNRKKKYCSSKCVEGNNIPHKCWKTAPLLCIPYIRKSQDDLLKYLIRAMQNMLGKPYPQKIDIFENTKYKPCIQKKKPPTTCEDIIPHEPECDDYESDEDNSKSKNPCNPCSRDPETNSRPRPPDACCPMPTPMSCPKGCTKTSNDDSSCTSLPFSLPNLNKIYTEPTGCSSDKCFSTLPPFLLPLSSVIQSESKKDAQKKTDSASSKPPTSTAKSLASIVNGESKSRNNSESITFFPPKKLAPEYQEKAKEINSDSLAGDNRLLSDQRANDKMLPEFEDYEEEEMKLLNITNNLSESPVTPSTSNEPFLFELQKFFSDEKHAPGFSDFSVNNSFSRRDSNSVKEYTDEVSPDNNSPGMEAQITHQKQSQHKPLYGENYQVPFPSYGDDVYQNLPPTPVQEYDEPHIGNSLLQSLNNIRKYFKSKSRKSAKRQKREDNYNGDDFVNDEGYFYDADGNNEDYEKQSGQRLKKEASNSDVYKLEDDDGWTPFQVEMFKELAKFVTVSGATYTSKSITFSTTPQPTATESSVEPSTIETTSTLRSQRETSSVASTTEKSSTSAIPTRKCTSQTAPSFTQVEKSSTFDIPVRKYLRKTTSPTVTQQYVISSETQRARGDGATHSSKKSSATVKFQAVQSEKQEKTPDVYTYIDTTEDGQVLTTVGGALIVKGPKKQMTRPSPKMYTRVYPDSVPIEGETNETTAATSTTDSTPEHFSLLRKTTAKSSAAADIKLQLLAVCEGYLEVVKLMKSQNQSFGEGLDLDLSSYCENIISQSLSQQTESPKFKKQEPNPGTETGPSFPKKVKNFMSESALGSSSEDGDAVLKKELDDKKFEIENVTGITAESNDNSGPAQWTKKENVKESKRKKKEYQNENENIPEADDEFLKKGMTKEQVELLHLLKKRKRALLNWLFNSREDQIQPEVEETEYFNYNEESNGNFLNVGNSSGTVRQRGAKSPGKAKKTGVVTEKKSNVPVYAKEYGYDKGGQLKQVEVLWRRINDETSERETYKNLSVLALVLTSTVAPNIFKRNYNSYDVNGYVNEDVSETREKRKKTFRLAPEETEDSTISTEADKKEKPAKTTPVDNSTVTFIRKPHPSSIIGTALVHPCTAATPTSKHSNITRQIAGKLNKAKGVVEDYTIEFWNYAVYILPIMFSILFFFCCACCAIHIFRTKKKNKKRKKIKKFESTDEDVSSDSNSEPKKRRRDKFRKSKNIWKVWKKKGGDEANTPEKNRNFLRILKSRKNKAERSSAPYSSVPNSSGKEDNHSEAAERRELIALLEELKKIEMEQVGEKKEQKSVHVQYMLQDHEESVLKRPEISKDYPFYSKSRRFHEPLAEEYGVFRDGELNELLPCECGYYRKKRDFLRNYGFRGNDESRCERLCNLLRGANACHHHHQVEKKKKFTDKDRNFIFDKYRNADINNEKDEAGFTIKVCDVSEFNLPPRNPNDWVGEMEQFNSQVMKKKHVRLKDDGVLCRL